MGELDRKKRSIWATEVHRLVLPPRLAAWWEKLWAAVFALFFLLLGILMAGWGGWLSGVDLYHWLRLGHAEWHTFGALSSGQVTDWVGLHKIVDGIHVGFVTIPLGLIFYWIGKARWPWKGARAR